LPARRVPRLPVALRGLRPSRARGDGLRLPGGHVSRRLAARGRRRRGGLRRAARHRRPRRRARGADRRSRAARGGADGRAPAGGHLQLRGDRRRHLRRVRGGGARADDETRVRIGIDASLASLAGSGTRRSAALLAERLVALDTANEYVLYFRARDRGENPLWGAHGPRLTSRVTDAPLTLLRLHLNLPVRLRADRVDLYHSLGFFVPWLWRGKTVVT